MRVFLTRLAFAFAAILIAAVAFVGAVGFICYAVFLFFAGVMPAPIAAIVTAIVLVCFAVMVLVIGRALVGVSTRARRGLAGGGTAQLEALIGPELAGLAAKSPFAATGIAFLVGLLFGVSPRLRRAAGDILRR